MRAFGVCGVLVYCRDQQPLRQDQRRLLAGPPSTVRHRGQVCVQGLRQARRRRAAGFSASPNGYRLVPRPSNSSLRASPPRRHDRRPARSGFTPRIEETPSRRIVPKLATLGKVTPEPHTQMPRPRDRFPAARFPQRPRWQRPSGGLCRQLACWCRRRSRQSCHHPLHGRMLSVLHLDPVRRSAAAVDTLTLGGVGSERINRQSGAGGFTGLMGFGPAGSGSIAGSGSVGVMVAPAACAASPVVE
jgi:hypothetical protein